MNINSKRPIVYFGRLEKHKGLNLLLKSYNILYNKNVSIIPPLWIIGGNYKEISFFKEQYHLRKMIRKYENKNLIFWWGQLPHDLLPLLLRHCSMFCFTSYYEPGGRTILEAMAIGLPIIATPNGIAKETINHGINGFIVKSNEPEEWANYMEFILENRGIAKKMGSISKKIIKSRFTMKHFYKKHWDIYNLENIFYPRIK